ncbi:hypothetical protein QJS04_geneDACA015400 [Acorus gramineus]|uniref:GYF domain-containing protein n=1 Tax=Acorus gramineus TaxID=55184 RepID=A0AAV9A7U6_ACOGR|nr:hypothetical protein QJS04_geneDACA015400 [Acorus gramineus]
MGERKLDLPDDLLSSKSPDEVWTSKGVDVDKAVLGFFDDSKDQGISENSIPLSPQWLYTKPSESKAGVLGAVGDLRATNPSHGNSTDSVQKEGWRLDGSQDRKEWRRSMPEIESGRRWREEERETGVLGRRDRRKEGDRESEYRKSDRRVDNRETGDSRVVPSADRWHDVGNRSSGYDSRRDSKWSSRWGPDDKEKDLRSEKRMELEKEDAQNEKQSFASSNRPAPERESDLRDKWRPRHRHEVHSGGSTVYRAAPGFGLERGRGEGSNVGFAPGRGRSSSSGASSFNRPSSAGPIGAPVDKNDSYSGKSVSSVDTFRYPRGKLLDIYRKCRIVPSFETIPDGLKELHPVTQLNSIEPLAFVIPDTNEEAVLEDISKGKVIGSGVINSSGTEKMGRAYDHGTGIGDVPLTESKQSMLPSEGIQETGESFKRSIHYDSYQGDSTTVRQFDKKAKALMTGLDSGHPTHDISKTIDVDHTKELGKHETISKLKVGETQVVTDAGKTENFGFSKDSMLENIEFSSSFTASAKVPDDLNMFNTLCIEEMSSGDDQYQRIDGEVKSSEKGTPEEMSLFYLDPQGDIQGPFSGLDIISWFEQGYFETDLLVCLSDAPEGTPLRELGEVIPHLKLIRPRPGSIVVNGNNAEYSDSGTIGMDFNSVGSASNCTAISVSAGFTTTVNDQKQASSGFNGTSDIVQSSISQQEDLFDSRHGSFAWSDLHTSAGIPNPDRQDLHELVGQGKGTQDPLFARRPSSGSGNHAEKSTGVLQDSFGNSVGNHHQFMYNEVGEISMLNNKVPTDNTVHPLGLLWSELEGSHPKRPLSSNISAIADQSHIINPAMRKDASHFIHKQDSYGALAESSVLENAWPNSHTRNSLANSNALQDAINAHHLARLEQESNRFNMTDHLMSQQLQKQQLQQPDLLSPHQNMHMNGSVFEQLQNSQHHQAFGQQIPEGLHPLRNHDPSIEQLIQAKYGQALHQEHPNDLMDLLHAKHRHMLSPDQQLLLDMQQEQQQMRQFSMAARHQPGIEEERHLGGAWAVDETGQFIRTAPSPHTSHPSGLSQLDIFKHQQRPFEQPSHLDRSFSLQERMRRGFFEQSSLPFERSLPMGAPGLNVDIANSLATRFQGLDMQENFGQMDPFPVSNCQVPPHWSESNGPLSSSWGESHIHRLHMEAERQKRDLELLNLNTGNPNAWASTGAVNDGESKRVLFELLNEKRGHRPSQSLEAAPTLSYERREPSWLFPGSSANHPFNHLVEEAGVDNSFMAVSHGRNRGQMQIVQERLGNMGMEGQVIATGNSDMLPFREEQFHGMMETSQPLRGDSNIHDNASLDLLTRIEGRNFMMPMSKGHVSSKSFSDALEIGVEQSGMGVIDHGDVHVNALNRHASLGNSGVNSSFVNYEMGVDNAYGQESGQDGTSGILSEGLDNTAPKHPNVLRIPSPCESLSDTASAPIIRGKNLINTIPTDERRRESNQVLESPAPMKKDMRSTSEPSFIDMLKSTKKPPPVPEPETPVGSSDPSDGGLKSGKKKGKKGRQIDPALLGFKVHSNRILMGEIQRPDD